MFRIGVFWGKERWTSALSVLCQPAFHLLSSVGRSLSAQLLEQTARLLALKNSVDSLRVRQAPPAPRREGGCPGGTPGPALLFPWAGEGEMNGHVSL